MKKIYKPWFSLSMDGFKADLTDKTFSVFEPLADHGYFTWIAGSRTKYRSLNSITDPKTFTDRIVLHGLPKKLVPYDDLQFPLSLKSLPSIGFYTKFPHAGFLAASLHVASRHRGVALDNLDFVLGGASLGILATRLNPRTAQVVFRVPSSTGKTIIGVHNNRKYFQDYASPGFQFERFVTGTEYNPNAPIEFSNHIHEMNIHSHRVLFVNQIDAFFDGEPVEIKTSRGYHRGIQVLFQLISSGSRWLCQAEKELDSIHSASLIHFSEVMYRTLVNKDRVRFENNLLESLSELRDQMVNAKEGELYDLIFKDGRMQLHRNTSDVVFPPPHVLSELLKSPCDHTVSVGKSVVT
jgi:hypothetical protein